jgi:hypothetical protein
MGHALMENRHQIGGRFTLAAAAYELRADLLDRVTARERR